MERLTKKEFKLPNETNLSSIRTSIKRAISNGIAPRIQPTTEEHKIFLTFFLKEENTNKHTCAYCGGEFHYYEHLRPLVNDKKPSGYGSDVYNLVPSCSACNQDKAGNCWELWMENDKNPGKQNVFAHQQRFERLREFEEWGRERVTRIDYQEEVGADLWKEYHDNLQKIYGLLEKAFVCQKSIREVVRRKVEEIKRKQEDARIE